MIYFSSCSNIARRILKVTPGSYNPNKVSGTFVKGLVMVYSREGGRPGLQVGLEGAKKMGYVFQSFSLPLMPGATCPL